MPTPCISVPTPVCTLDRQDAKVEPLAKRVTDPSDWVDCGVERKGEVGEGGWEVRVVTLLRSALPNLSAAGLGARQTCEWMVIVV